MISTALAARWWTNTANDAPLLEAGGRALREMTRISASSLFHVARHRPHQQEQIFEDALLKLEQRLAHIRENLDTRELAMEFERAHQLKKIALAKTKQSALKAVDD